MTATADVLRLEAAIVAVPGVLGALQLVATSYRSDAETLGATMTPGQRLEALGLLAESLLMHDPGLADGYGSWPAAVRGLTLVLAVIVHPPEAILAEPTGPAN